MRTSRIVTLIVLFLTSPTFGQDLYSLDGVEFETIVGTMGAKPYGIDVDGWVYDSAVPGVPGYALACYHLDDPEGTLVTPDLGKGTSLAAMRWDHSGMAILSYGDGQPTFRFLRCVPKEENPDGYIVEELGSFPISLKPLAPKESYNTPGAMIMAPDNAFCFDTWEGLRCGHPDPESDTIEFDLRIDLSQMNDLVSVDPGLAQDVVFAGSTTEPDRQWELRSVLWLPDGRMFSMVAIRFFSSDGGKDYSDSLPYVLEHNDDGTVNVWIEPPRPAKPGYEWMWGDAHVKFSHPLNYAETLYYTPHLDAILAWPIPYGDYLCETVKKGTYIGPGGPGGQGFMAIPLAGNSALYLSMLHGRHNGKIRPVDLTFQSLVLPNNELGFVFPLEEEGKLQKVVFNLARLDLDHDGLSHNEELALGTSDFTIASDGSTTADSVEVAASLTDPTDFWDDPAPWRPGRFSYVEGGLIRKLLDDLGLTDEIGTGPIAGTSPHGPMCLKQSDEGMECILKDRTTRVTVPVPYGANLQFDHSGRFVIYQAEEGLFRYWFADGQQELAVSTEEMWMVLGSKLSENLDPKFFPAGDDLVYVSYYELMQEGSQAWDEFFVAAFSEGQPGKLIYDHQKARCDSGLGLCDATWEEQPDSTKKTFHDLLFNGVGVLGYLPEMDRLVLNVAGRWGRYFVGLHPEEPPTVLIGPRYLKGGGEIQGMPSFIQPTGHDDYFVGRGFMDGWLNARNNSRAQGMLGTTPTSFFWDSIGLNFYYGGDGLWELIRYEGFGKPGDVVLVTHAGNQYGFMAYRSGPRGGLADAWLEPVPDFKDVWGIDIRHDGMLCLSDRTNDGGSVFILEPGEPNGVGSNLIMVAGELGDVTDCHWGEDDSLYFVTTNPPRLMHLPELWVENFEVYADLPVGTEPLDLIVTPEGDFEILDANGPYRGFYYLSDGRRLEVSTSDWWVWVDGEQVVQLTQLMFGKLGVEPGDKSHCFIRFMERPDGLVVAVPMGSNAPVPIGGRAWVFDPNTGEKWPLSSNPVYPFWGNGLAILPDGVAKDPWGSSGLAQPEAGPGAPEPPPTQSTGYPVMRDKGCAFGTPDGAENGWWLLALALGLLVAVRVRQALVAVALALGLAVGCGGADGPDNDYVHGSFGQGDENQEPVMPLVVGSRTVVREGVTILHRVVAAKVTIDGKEGRRVEWSDGTVNVWKDTDEGWALAATSKGKLDPTILMVPHQLRVGKAWTSDLYSFTVAGHGVEATPWGKRMTWQILRIGPDGVKLRHYVEGRGWWKDGWTGDKEVIASFVPLDSLDVSEPQLKKTSLQPLLGPDGQQLVLEMEGEVEFSVEDEPGAFVMGARGVSWAFLFGSWGLVSHNQCLRIDESDVQLLSWQQGAGFVKTDNAQCFAPKFSEIGDPTYTHKTVLPWITADSHEYYYVEGDQVGTNQVLALLGTKEDAQPQLFSLYGEYAKQTAWGNEAFDNFPDLPAYLDPMDLLTHFDPRMRSYLHPMHMEDDFLPFGRLTESGVLVENRILAGGEFAIPELKMYVGFEPTMTTLLDGHRALLAHANHIDEVYYKDGKPVLERLVAYDLLPNHFPTGAVRVGTRVVLTTGDRVTNADPFNGLDGREMYFWEFLVPAGAAQPLETPASLAVSAMQSGSDVVVCWPESDEPLESDGWTIGGAPAAKVVVVHGDGNCALIMRDYENSVDIWLNGGGLVQGPVPGVGRMEVVVPRGPTQFQYQGAAGPSPADVWPTPDGGLVGLHKVFSEVGTPLRRGPHAMVSNTGLTSANGVQDAAGNGFWHLNGGFAELITSDDQRVLASEGWENAYGRPENIFFLGQDYNGGALLKTPAEGQWGNYKIHVDGTVEQLPFPPEEAYFYNGLSYAAISADGYFCGTASYDILACHKDEWVIHEEPPEGIASYMLYPLADNKLVLVGSSMWEGTGQLLDPATMELETFEPEMSFSGQFKYDPEGNLFFLRQAFNPGWGDWQSPEGGAWPLAVTSQGVTPLEMPRFDRHSGYQGLILSVVPTFDYFFVFFESGQFARVMR